MARIPPLRKEDILKKFDSEEDQIKGGNDYKINFKKRKLEDSDYPIVGDYIMPSSPSSTQRQIPSETPQTPQRHTPERYDGDVLQKYELVQIIADGRENGQGIVARARRIEDGKDVVVKKYSEARNSSSWEGIEDGEIGATREISFLERANRDGVKGVPQLIEYGETGRFIKEPVAVFEFIPGRTLEEEVVDESYTPSMELMQRVVNSLTGSLSYAHSSKVKPVVHRDINPKNIMVNGNDPVLMDWATSKATSGKTSFGTQFVTPYYTAPEVLEGKPFDGRADIYSLGKVLELICLGNDVFTASDGNPIPRDFENLNLPKELVRVLLKATQTDPKNRYKTIKAFYDAFVKGVNGQTIQKRAGALEKKVEGVKLTEAERKRARNKAIVRWVLNISSPMWIGYGVSLYSPGDVGLSLFAAGLLAYGTGAFYDGRTKKFQDSLRKHYENKMLKKKRKAAGLPAKPEMINFDLFEAEPKNGSPFMETKLKLALSKLGLKRKSFQRKLAGDGVEVRYKSIYHGGPAYDIEIKDRIVIDINCEENSVEKAREVYNKIKKHFKFFGYKTRKSFWTASNQRTTF